MAAPVRYTVSFPRPQDHFIHVAIEVAARAGETVVFRMPRWSPGWYVFQEYARWVDEVAAEGPGGEPLALEHPDHCTWSLTARASGPQRLRYRRYARHFSDDDAYLDEHHCGFLGTALFMAVPGQADGPQELRLVRPAAWPRISTALPAIAGEDDAFRADDFDHLVDSPCELGAHDVHRFEVRGRPHELAVVGTPAVPVDWPQVTADLAQIVDQAAEFMGGLPYERYLFLLYIMPKPTGSLEHRDSTTCTVTPDRFHPPKTYRKRWLTLAAHEFFHLWNVKRIRPAELIPLDYFREQHSTLMWFFEGYTAYFDNLIVAHAGLTTAKEYLSWLAEDIDKLLGHSGRRHQTLADSSFDAWIKFNRAEEHTPHTQISFYVKGALFGLCLDLELRALGGELIEVLRRLYRDAQAPGYRGLTEARFRQVVAALVPVAERERLSALIDLALRGREDLDLAHALAHVGLRLEEDWGEPPKDDDPDPRQVGFLGVETEVVADRLRVKTVRADAPALAAGLAPADELIALDGHRLDAGDLPELLKARRPGQTAVLTIARHRRLREVRCELGAPPATKWKITPLSEATDEQRARFQGWCGMDFASLKEAESK